METYFAPPDRAEPDTLTSDLAFLTNNDVVDGILRFSSGIVAILNEQRQILSVNDSFLKMLGIENPDTILGLRPGEAIDCTHAEDMKAGCGTGKFCATCGAAIAIVSSLAKDSIEERKCVVTIQKGTELIDLCLSVRSSSISFKGKRFILLFLEDITHPERRAAIERVFFHDINNLLMGIVGTAYELGDDDNNSEDLSELIYKMTSRLSTEISIQRVLSLEDSYTYHPDFLSVTTGIVIGELKDIFANHALVRGKKIIFPENDPQFVFETDLSLLVRILANMLTNALEATAPGGVVTISFSHDKDSITFTVWNQEEIPDDIAQRIFQHHFSTKKGEGRGLGTYAIKLFGEKFMGGQVAFTTSEDTGTAFHIKIPLQHVSEFA